MKFIKSDGGRSKYFKGSAGDCVVRAICNATGKDYLEVYNRINELSKNEKVSSKKRRTSSSRNGVYKNTYKKYIEKELGLKRISLSGIGKGISIHLKEEELPKKGTYILRLSKHLTCWKDGKLIDTYNCSREGTRGVYGYWEVK